MGLLVVLILISFAEVVFSCFLLVRYFSLQGQLKRVADTLVSVRVALGIAPDNTVPKKSVVRDLKNDEDLDY